MIKYTEEQKEFLKENSGKYSRKELTVIFNNKFGTDKNVDAIRSFCKKNGFYASTDGKFQKGNKPWSTGLSKEEHRSHFSDKSYDAMTSQLDARAFHEVGDIYQMKFSDGKEIPYRVMSTDYSIPFKKRIMPLARYIWEETYGKIPEGYFVLHLDGDVQNCDLDNLELVSSYERRVLANNNWHGKGEITKVGIMYARLKGIMKEKGAEQ